VVTAQDQQVTTGRKSPGPRGLATLALLKTRFDAGYDHLGLLEPFVVDVIPLLGNESFTTAECQAALECEHGLRVPQDALITMLARVVRTGAIRRDAGRYWPSQPGLQRTTSLRVQREASELAFAKIGERFVAFASEKGVVLGTPLDGLALLIGFIAENEVVFLLDEVDGRTQFSHRVGSGVNTRLSAAFLLDVGLRDAELRDVLDRLLRGMVLQNALLLKDVADLKQKMSGLTVYFDTGFVFALVGAKGPAAELAAKESLGLLRATGAKLAVFERTVDEMRRILNVYERHLATAEGRLTLHASELTYYFLTTKAPPSDVRTMSATLRLTVESNGVKVSAIPARKPDFTWDETALANELKPQGPNGKDARVGHDVDCIAGILQHRKGRDVSLLENAEAIFATTSGTVLRSVNDWYRAQGGKGVSPIIHQRTLCNIAWLKKPAAVQNLQLHQLAALCEAALQPSASVWLAFKRTLTKLRDEGRISTDEAVAVAASEMTVPALSELPDDVEPDAANVIEVIERVKRRYHLEATQLVATKEKEAQERIDLADSRVIVAESAREGLEKSIDDRSTQVSQLIAYAACGLVLLLILAMIALGLPGVFDGIPTTIRVLAWAVIAVAVGLQLWSFVSGWSLKTAHASIALKARPRIRRLLSGR